MASLTPQEKLMRKIPLTEADKQQLLENPQDWTSIAWKAANAIEVMNEDDYFLLCKAIADEEYDYKLAEEEEEYERYNEAREEARKQLLLNANIPAAQAKTIAEKAQDFVKSGMTIATVQAILQTQMRSLLAVSQTHMTSNQLTEYHQELTANLSNQLSARLGTSVALDGGPTLNVPQLPFNPPPSLDQILTHNPGLANIMLSQDTPEQQNAMVNVFAQAELIRMAFRKAQEIREFNPESELKLTVKDRINLQNKADNGLHDLLNFNTTTKKYDNPIVIKLEENAQLSAKRYVEKMNLTKTSKDLLSEVSASLSEPPAMFSPYPAQKNTPRPTPGNIKKKNFDDEHGWKPRDPTAKS